jgi:hypothetical protein
MIGRIAVSALVLSLTATGAFALTVTNKTSKDTTIGVDYGNKEVVEKVAGGQSVKIKGCNKDDCGITGPWGYSWMAKSGDTLVFDDHGLKPSNM